MKRTSSLPVVVVIAVIALVLGSIGTAVAGPVLTQGKVKKIAKKVVKKQAPTLSVANSTLLNGQPATAYQNKSYRYRLPTGAAATATKTFTFTGLPQGTYLATYAAEFTTSPAGSVGCYFLAVGSGMGGEGASYTNSGSIALTSSSAIVQVGPTGVLLYCFGLSVSFAVYPGLDARSSVSFTQVDSLTESTAVGTRSAVEGADGAVAGGIAP